MSDETYNGWEGTGSRASAYATWRIKLELFDDDYARESFGDEKPDGFELAEWLEENAREWIRDSVDDQDEQKIATQYAMAFLDDVSWEEIAENMLSDWPDNETEDDDG
jgi:hypothetical protein